MQKMVQVFDIKDLQIQMTRKQKPQGPLAALASGYTAEDNQTHVALGSMLPSQNNTATAYSNHCMQVCYVAAT